MPTTVRKAIALIATAAAVGILASCTAAPAEAPAAAGDTPAPIVVPTETAEPVAGETPEPTPTVDPASVEGLDAGAELTPEQCSANLNKTAFDGRAYELLDGTCVLVRYGEDQPVPEPVRADMEARAQSVSDPTRAFWEAGNAERAGVEVAYLTCSPMAPGSWGAFGPMEHGSYDEMVRVLDEWVAAGTSRTWVTVSTC